MKRYDWGYVAEPEDTLDGRAIAFPCGRVIGGSGSINGMIYVRGHTNDPMAVVDSECRVHSVDGLRVADSSIFTRITNGNLNAPTIMVAEKAADRILGVKCLHPLIKIILFILIGRIANVNPNLKFII